MIPHLVIQLAIAVAGLVTPVDKAATATVALKGFPDFLEIGFGSVWVTNTGDPRSKDNGSIQRIDPKTNKVIATIELRSQPRFLAAGEGAVWVLNQRDGSVSRIDPETNKVVATVEAGVAGFGG